MFSLNHKIALITGAGSGIGAAIAEVFAQAGARVVVVDRDRSSGEAVAQKLGGVFALCDVSSPEECNALAVAHPNVDVLVNNAGIGHVGSLLNTTAEDLDRMYAVNVRGVFNVCKALIPAMLERGTGSVINMASVGGIIGIRDRLAYTATKFAVVGLTKALALDHSHTGVRFNCICPGRVETPFVLNRLAEYPDPEKARGEMSATQLVGRMIRPDEIAASALYLAADESVMVTGSTLVIDGGWSAGK